MKRGKKLIGLVVAVILGLSLILVPVVSQLSPAQAAVTWTKYPGEVTLDSERYVVDAWVIRESSTSYKMWYTHGKSNLTITQIIDVIKGLSLTDLVTDAENLDVDGFLDNLSDLSVGTIEGVLDGTATVIGYATSNNGVDWTRVESQALGDSNTGFWNSVGAPSVIKDDAETDPQKRYKMWYTRLDTDLNQTSLQNYLTDLGGNDATRKAAILNLLGSTRTVIGYATSPYGETWTVRDNEVLPAGGDKLWNSVGAPSVIKDDAETDPQKRYKMWYTRTQTDQTQTHLDTVLSEINTDTFGIAEIIDIINGTSTVIAYATSPDGTTWTPGNLNWTPSITALWDSVADPSVIKDDAETDPQKRYKMWYTNGTTDLIEANLGTLLDNIVALGPVALWNTLKNEGIAEFITDLVALDIDTIKSVLSGTSTVIGYATSSDGINWTVQATPDLAGSGPPWDSVAAPSVVKTGSSYEMWYTEGFRYLTWQNILDLILGDNLPIGYAYYIPVVPPPPPPPPLTIETELFGIEASFRISSTGEILETIEATSEDENLTVTIEVGTIALDIEGEPLETLTAAVDPSPPAPPEDSNVIGLAYDFGPDGATFDPPIILTFTYDELLIPEGVAEENLVIAMWDAEAGEWVNLVSIVNPETNTITAKVSHFTAFTVLAYTRPAVFVASDLSITPAEVDIGETVTISVLATNTGDLTDSYEVTLKIDNVVVATKEVTLIGGASQRVSFTATKDVAGTYSVDVSGLTGSFTVKEEVVPPVVPLVPAAFTISSLTISPTEVDVGKSVTISVLITNTGELTGSYEATLKIDNVVVDTKEVTLASGTSQGVSFTATKDVAGTYSVDVSGLTGSFTVKEKVVPLVAPKPIAWWVWLIVGLGVVVIGGLLAYFLWWRRRIA